MNATPVPEPVALVAEDHLHDVHRRAEVVRDAVRAPVDLRPRRVPGVEDGAHRARELLARVLRERRPRLVLVDPLEGADELAQVVGVELDVLLHSALGLQVAERLLEAVRVDARHDLAVHLDQAAVRVVREARVAGARRQPVAPPRR